MRILVALGGSALLGSEEAAGAARQRDMEAAADALATLAGEHQVVLSHGAGPRDGQMLELALRNALPDRNLITVLTEVVVSAEDRALRDSNKPMVPSPEPHAIVELPSLRTLIDAGVLVICARGGGVPIAIDGGGGMRGVEAVIDEDLTAALLARRLDVDLLLLLTDVEAVHRDWGSDGASPLRSASPPELRAMRFAADSMGPKVEAACRFVEATGRRAAVGALTDAVEIARGKAGTQISTRDALQASA